VLANRAMFEGCRVALMCTGANASLGELRELLK
jgi:hypothetical protein